MKNFGKILIICLIFIISFVTFKSFAKDDTAQDKAVLKKVSKYMNCELGDLVGDDVKRIKVAGFNVDYHSNDFSKKQVKLLAKECKKEGVFTQYQMDCCMTMKMFPNEK